MVLFQIFFFFFKKNIVISDGVDHDQTAQNVNFS